MGFFSDLFGGGEKKELKRARELQERMLREWETLQIPSAEEMELRLPDYTFRQEYTPYLQEEVAAPETAMLGVEADPEAVAAERQVLDDLTAIAEDPTLSDIDKAALYDIISQQRGAARGSREAILQNLQERGILGAGQELVSKQMAEQAAAARGAAGGYELAGQAEARRRGALNALAELGSRMRGESFEEQSNIAKSRDLIEQFNAQLRQQQQAANVLAQQKAQQQNIEQAEREAQANYAARVAEAESSSELPKTLFEMQRQKLAGRTGQAGEVADAGQKYGEARTKSAQGIMGAAETGLKTAANLAPFLLSLSDREVKENISPLNDQEARDLLGSLTGYKYEYKEGNGDQHIGVMAQDMERTPQGEDYVTDTPAGKAIEYDPNMLTALLANLNDRVEKMEKTYG